MPTNPRPAYQKKRYWILMILVVLLASGGVLILAGKRELQHQLVELSDAGLPTNGQELNDFYVVPDGIQDTTELWMEAIDGVAAGKFSQAIGNLPFIGEGDEPVIGEEWSELDAARHFLTAHAAELQAIRTAANAGGAVRFPGVDFRSGVNTLLKNTQESRTIARLLTLDAHVSQRDGNHQQAAQDIIDTFTLSDALQREPTLVSQLVRVAIYSVACDTTQKLLPVCNWNDEQLAALQTAAAGLNAREALTLAMHGERAISLEAVKRMPFVGSNRKELIRLFGKTLLAMENPWHEAIAGQEDIVAELEASNQFDRIRYAAVHLLFPSLLPASQAGARSSASQFCIIAALAAERVRLAQGEYPNSLASIPPKLLPAKFVTDNWIDPFTGKPLIYLKTDTGIIVYSIGRDLVDDGGKIQPNKDSAPSDIGFSITN